MIDPVVGSGYGTLVTVGEAGVRMFELFTLGARGVLIRAQEEARRLDSRSIGTEHFLVGLIDEEQGLAAKALKALGVTLDHVRGQIERVSGPADARTRTGPPQFTQHARQVLELSFREAMQLGHGYVGTEHMLLGIARIGDCTAAQVLAKGGADQVEVRQAVMQLVPPGGAGPPRLASIAAHRVSGAGKVPRYAQLRAHRSQVGAWAVVAVVVGLAVTALVNRHATDGFIVGTVFGMIAGTVVGRRRVRLLRVAAQEAVFTPIVPPPRFAYTAVALACVACGAVSGALLGMSSEVIPTWAVGVAAAAAVSIATVHLHVLGHLVRWEHHNGVRLHSPGRGIVRFNSLRVYRPPSVIRRWASGARPIDEADLPEVVGMSVAAHRTGRYAIAAALSQRLFEQHPAAIHAYNQACSLARLRKKRAALACLDAAAGAGWSDVARLDADDDLDSLRDDPHFEMVRFRMRRNGGGQ